MKAGSTAAGNGACINVQASTETAKAGEIEIKGGTFSENKAKGNGGVMNVYTDTVVTITGGMFVNNEAEADGGAVAIAASTIALEANKVYMNIKDNTVDSVNDVVFEGNKANRGGAIFIIQKGTVATEKVLFEANESTGNGGAIITYGAYRDENSKFDGNKSTGGNGGAIIVMSDGTASMTGSDTNAQFVDNSLNNASKNGAALFIQGSVTLKGYSFEDDTQSIYVTGTLEFDDLTSALIKQGSANAKLRVVGSDFGESVEIALLADNYVTKKQIVSAATGVDANVLKAACEKIKITDEADGTKWKLTDDGKLALANPAAKMTINGVEDTYKSLKAAVDVANTNGSLDTATTIYLLRNATVDGQIKIEKNITIQNEPGVNVTITRGKIANSETMFYVGNSNNNLAATLTLGTNDSNEVGTITIDGENKTVTSRFIDNRGAATLILAKNTSLINVKSNQYGAVVVNRGSMTSYGNINDVVCTGAGGAILQIGDKSPQLIIESGSYKNNIATRPASDSKGPSLGGFLRVDNGTVTINGGTFSNNTTTGSGNTIYSKGTIIINSGATFVGTDDVIHMAAGSLTVNNATLTPTTYTEGTAMLTKASEVDATAFATACGNITVSAENGKSEWYISSNGQLTRYEAGVTTGANTLYYKSLSDAVTYANTNGGTGESDNIVITILKNVAITGEIVTSKNITLVNATGKEITISRGNNMTANMFNIQSGSALILGSNDAAGKLIVDGYTQTPVGKRIIENSGSFTLGKNATLTNANANASAWGCALINKATTSKAYLYGTITNNICAGATGAVLNNNGTIYIYEGMYSNNSSTRATTNSSGPSQGGFLRVYNGTAYIYGGTFTNNSTTGNGGAIYIDSGKTAYITGGTFSNNSSDSTNTGNYSGNDIYSVGTLNYSKTNVTTSTDGIKGTGTINSNYSGQ